MLITISLLSLAAWGSYATEYDPSVFALSTDQRPQSTCFSKYVLVV